MDIQPKQHADLNYLVVGLGVTGFSVANYLLAHGYRCRVQDTRDIPPYLSQLKSLYPQVEVKKARLDDDQIGWVKRLLRRPPNLVKRLLVISNCLHR
jgi:UDP-N-acetylmuramoylalanine--D-glutamate ligase